MADPRLATLQVHRNRADSDMMEHAAVESASPTGRNCSNCGIAISWMPVLAHGTVYCCEGCAQGGPCICTYDQDPWNLGLSEPISPTPLNSTMGSGGGVGSSAQKISPYEAGSVRTSTRLDRGFVAAESREATDHGNHTAHEQGGFERRC